MSERLGISPEALHERAAAGEFVFISGRTDGRQYPSFQLDQRLNKPLLKQTILKFQEADVNSHYLWSFLRSSEKVYSGLTSIEFLLGGVPPYFDKLTSEERSEYFLEVVDETLSRWRW